MTQITGNDSDNFLRGHLTLARNEKILGKAGNDTLEGIKGNDTLLGGKDDDRLFAGIGNDLLSGDGDSITLTNGVYRINSGADKGNDVLVGGKGTDILVAWGDDTLVGGGPDRYNEQLVSNLGNDPFTTSIAKDKQRDTFIALNKDKVDYTLTIVDYEVGIDRINLRAFGVRSANHFEEIQNKGDFFELKTPVVGEAELVLRINVNPVNLSYV